MALSCQLLAHCDDCPRLGSWDAGRQTAGARYKAKRSGLAALRSISLKEQV